MAATVRAQDVIALFRKAYNEKWGYIWGASGQVHTQRDTDGINKEGKMVAINFAKGKMIH